jgi:hypothetical protein
MKWHGWLALAIILALLGGIFVHLHSLPPRPVEIPAPRPQPAAPKPAPHPAESLLAGYADPASPPIEDLRKLHRVVTGYFSVVKDPARHPIGGNADLAAALRGENPNREVFLPAAHPVFSADGLLLDRWGSPLIVHPQAWRELELRSAGPDRTPYSADDLVLLPTGTPPPPPP